MIIKKNLTDSPPISLSKPQVCQPTCVGSKCSKCVFIKTHMLHCYLFTRNHPCGGGCCCVSSLKPVLCVGLYIHMYMHVFESLSLDMAGSSWGGQHELQPGVDRVQDNRVTSVPRNPSHGRPNRMRWSPSNPPPCPLPLCAPGQEGNRCHWRCLKCQEEISEIHGCHLGVLFCFCQVASLPFSSELVQTVWDDTERLCGES